MCFICFATKDLEIGKNACVPKNLPQQNKSTCKFFIHERDKHDKQTDIQRKFLNRGEAPKSEACEVHISTPSVFFKQINENKYINKSEAG